MKYIIMCGGSYLKVSKPKPLVEIQGETLISRTIRLLKTNGINKNDIIISSNNSAFDNFGVKRIANKKNTWAEGQKGYWLDAFLPFYQECTYLYGDVYYTEETIKTIIKATATVTETTLVGSSIARNGFHKNWGEPFAYIIKDPQAFQKAIQEVKILQDEGKITRHHAITWEVYRYMNGFDVNIQYINDDTFIPISDITIDIDNEEDIPKLLEKLGE